MLFAGMAGAVSALAMAPFNWIGVLFLSLPLLYILLDLAGTRWQAFLTGWLFGLGYHIAGLYWIANALLVEGNPYSWAWPLAAIVLPALLAVYFGLAALLTWCLAGLRTVSGYLLFVIALFAAEYLRGHLFTGFPWNILGYGWGGLWPVVQIVEYIGIYGLTLLTILWCSLPAFLILVETSRISKSMLSLGAVLVVCTSWGVGANQLNNNNPHGNTESKSHFVVIQPNIAQHNKWRNDKLRANFQRHLAPSYYDETIDIAEDATTFIVWPETALAYFHLRTPGIRDQIARMLQSYPGKAYLISGALLKLEKKSADKVGYANAIIAINDRGRIIQRYKKSHLVPFGEYIPLKDLIPLQPVAEFNNLVAGKNPEPLRIDSHNTFYPLICYEVIFPGLLDNKAKKSDYIINVTNDAWYSHSTGPYQHFMQARYRAVESQKPLIRAANTGISGIIDSQGRVLTRTQIFTEKSFHLKLPR
jgi:apolipoprotein N-acyltransferase